ncbi:unnamed protein product [Pleuronectes platessa]|uniref:Uncharacterized protein n=1 Tax=Pleuronectes platessa TaxID=8262 RepID=A0A9N7URV3_PLEPL|nr:unnamed protein product [Pleuronectes platessa]
MWSGSWEDLHVHCVYTLCGKCVAAWPAPCASEEQVWGGSPALPVAHLRGRLCAACARSVPTPHRAGEPGGEGGLTGRARRRRPEEEEEQEEGGRRSSEAETRWREAQMFPWHQAPGTRASDSGESQASDSATVCGLRRGAILDRGTGSTILCRRRRVLGTEESRARGDEESRASGIEEVRAGVNEYQGEGWKSLRAMGLERARQCGRGMKESGDGWGHERGQGRDESRVRDRRVRAGEKSQRFRRGEESQCGRG